MKSKDYALCTSSKFSRLARSSVAEIGSLLAFRFERSLPCFVVT